MPPRDEQDYETRRQQIIDGALQVFSTKGFERATNKDIAHAAKIGSPGLIYHYFKDKTDLFRQVLEQHASPLQLLANADELMDRPPAEVLGMFADSFVSAFAHRSSVAMFKLLLGESFKHPAMADLFNHIGPGRGFAFLRRYMEHQMDKGTLRRVDPGAAVRAFIGPMLAYAIMREVFVQPDSRTLDARTMIDTHLGIYLRGMAAHPEDEQ
ncbi:MAG TPA: TetR/AcrR family transcriptional regulator [Chloroflexia bacterium]|jgi:AcrR family transcriptional regulator|nr:TetR/AcrR family transcriptional regulator [Chloroflexia bacterium]